ncbi:MAG TPA: sulfotransferase [Myxococcota bacterium]|nr:sulfotransferase [Myxococcota bacterium]
MKAALRSGRRALLDRVDDIRYLRWRWTAPRGLRLDRPIFIVGAARSGTSMSVRILGRHPDLANWSEAGRFYDPRHYDDLEADHQWGAERATAAEVERLHSRFEFERQSRGKPRFINKHPRSSVRLDYLRAIFPDAYFLHVIRDGRAVARSMVERLARYPRRPQSVLQQFVKPPGWRALQRENQYEEAILQWRAVVRHVRSHREILAGRYFEYRYEDFCDQPKRILSQVLVWAELDSSDEVVDELVSAPLQSRNYKFAETLSPQDIAFMNRSAGDLLAELGYSV